MKREVTDVCDEVKDLINVMITKIENEGDKGESVRVEYFKQIPHVREVICYKLLCLTYVVVIIIIII